MQQQQQVSLASHKDRKWDKQLARVLKKHLIRASKSHSSSSDMGGRSYSPWCVLKHIRINVLISDACFLVFSCLLPTSPSLSEDNQLLAVASDLQELISSNSQQERNETQSTKYQTIHLIWPGACFLHADSVLRDITD